MKVRIIVERLPLHFIILAIFFIVYGLGSLFNSTTYVFSGILLLLGVLMVTSWQEIIVDKQKKVFHEFYRILGFRVKDFSETYQEITAIKCKAVNYQQEYGKYNRRFLSGVLFRGYLELDGQKSLYLGQNKIKKQLLRKLGKAADQLGVAVEDLAKETE